MSGSCSKSFKEEMQGGVFRSEMEKMELKMVAAPVSQGSMRIVKEPGNRPGEERGATGGVNVKRKAVSPFKDRRVNDMTTSAVDDDVRKHGELHREDDVRESNKHLDLGLSSKKGVPPAAKGRNSP